MGPRESLKGNLKIYKTQLNKNTTYQNMRNAAKVVLGGNFTV